MSQYDAFAQDFSQSRSKKSSWPEFELLYPLLNNKDRILDLGCGNGRLRQWLSKDTSKKDIPEGHYFGLDTSDKLLEIARKRYPKDHFFRGNMSQKLPFGAEHFDIVTGIASFHHLLNKQDQRKCLSEIYRVLKPGGQVFLTTWMLPKKYFWENILRGRFKNWNIPFGTQKKPRTYRWVTKRELKNLCKKSGLQIEHAEYFERRNLVVIAQKQ